MKKTLTILGRSALMLGLLVALTPCDLCHSDSLKTLQKGHGCCADQGTSPSSTHSDRGPLCQVMDQSSLSVETVHLDLPALLPTAQEGLSTLRVVGMTSFQSVPAFSSPPRSPQVLRI